MSPTTPATTSLIERNQRQLELMPSSAMDAAIFSEAEAAGEYTAEILYERRRSTYMAAVSFLAEGIGILRIARLLHISPSSVIAVREREGSAIEIEKARLSRLARAAARLCVEAIVDVFGDPKRLADLSPRDLGIIHGILIDKADQLEPRGGSAGGDQGAAPGHTELMAYLGALRARAMGLGEETGAQTAAGAAGEARGMAAGEAGSRPGTIDVTDQVETHPPAGPAGGRPDELSDAEGRIAPEKGDKCAG